MDCHPSVKLLMRSVTLRLYSFCMQDNCDEHEGGFSFVDASALLVNNFI